MTSTSREIMVVAGEPSGDLHASHLVEKLSQEIPGLSVFGMGGDRMRRQGVEVLHDFSHLTLIGFGGLLRLLPRLRTIRRSLIRRVRKNPPEAIILVDYPGFNLHLARALNRLPKRPRLIYFIPPQVWGWWRSRARTVARCFDLILTILPFEPPFYLMEGGRAEFVGSPVAFGLRDVPARGAAREALGLGSGERVVALLPGSRPKEIENHFPEMAGAARLLRERFPETVFLVSEAEALPEGTVSGKVTPVDGFLRVVRGRTHEVIRSADAAIVVNGTVSFEAGLLETPMVVLYRSDYLTYYLVKYYLSRVDYMCLVNLLVGREVVPEIYQRDVEVSMIARKVAPLLEDAEAGRLQVDGFAGVRRQFDDADPYGNAARRIRELLGERG